MSSSGACFVWCDIDGRGKKWRLAVPRRMDDGEDGLYFPVEDFEDLAEGYADDPVQHVIVPRPLTAAVDEDEAMELMDNGRNTGGKQYRAPLKD